MNKLKRGFFCMSSEASLLASDQLEAVLYQFITLYERGSHDQQLTAKQGEDMAKLVALLTEQVNHFKQLEANVRQQLIDSVHASVSRLGEKASEAIHQASVKKTDHAIDRLRLIVREAEQTLMSYQRDVAMRQWKLILVSVVTTVVTCLLLVWLLIPKPTLPLDDRQLGYLEGGQLMQKVWPKLSKKEQDRLLDLVRAVTAS